jgi:hypothetical protein
MPAIPGTAKPATSPILADRRYSGYPARNDSDSGALLTGASGTLSVIFSGARMTIGRPMGTDATPTPRRQQSDAIAGRGRGLGCPVGTPAPVVTVPGSTVFATGPLTVAPMSVTVPRIGRPGSGAQPRSYRFLLA